VVVEVVGVRGWGGDREYMGGVVWGDERGTRVGGLGGCRKSEWMEGGLNASTCTWTDG